MIQTCVVLNGFVMASTLAFLGVLSTAVTVNHQVDVITTDCYERLASGQRLHATDVYKTIKVTTLQDCQIACTEEKEMCRSFSYGVGTKANASCEMSNTIVKETADLKPIGTVNDTNYDLYIKKTGCKLVIEINKNKNKTPTSTANDQTRYNDNNNNKNQDAAFGQYDRPPQGGSFGDNSFDAAPNRPFHDYEAYGGSSYDYNPPGYGFMYAPNFYGPPIKVQSSLISVSPIATNDLESENGANERKNYLSYKDDRYAHYNRPGVYEEPGNSLDTANRPVTDRLPPLFSSNYKPGQLYAEESSYEQHSNQFSSSSYEYAAPFPDRIGNRYPPQDERPSPEYGRPQFGDLEYGKPHIADNNEYRPDVHRPISHNLQSGDRNFMDHRNHGQDSFEDQKGFDRLYERPTYRPQSTNDQPDRYYDNWPSYAFEPAYTEFTYGNRYPFYKQSDDKLQYTETSPIKDDDTANHPVSTNKTEPFGATNITATSFETELNYTEANSTAVSFSNGSIVSQTKGPHGETITSIITELEAGELVPHWVDRDLVSDYYRRHLEVICKMKLLVNRN